MVTREEKRMEKMRRKTTGAMRGKGAGNEEKMGET